MKVTEKGPGVTRCSISQTFSTSGGTFTLGFQAAQRPNEVQQLQVTVQPYPPPTVVRNFVWNGNEIAEERDASGSTVTKRFFAEGEQRVGGSDAGNYYYSRDHLGSVREVTDAAGALKGQYDYDAYGNRVVLSGNLTFDFGYAGYFHHAPSGLDLTLYRAYNPGLGRWISRDPIGEQGGINLYGYVSNDPMNLFDTMGLFDNGADLIQWGRTLTPVIPAVTAVAELPLLPITVAAAAGAGGGYLINKIPGVSDSVTNLIYNTFYNQTGRNETGQRNYVYENAAREAQETGRSICEILADRMSAERRKGRDCDSQLVNDIKRAQKAAGCRRSNR